MSVRVAETAAVFRQSPDAGEITRECSVVTKGADIEAAALESYVVVQNRGRRNKRGFVRRRLVIGPVSVVVCQIDLAGAVENDRTRR